MNQKYPKRVYRCSHDIIFDILRALREKGSSPITSLCLKARVPVDRGIKTLSHLETMGLVSSHMEKRKQYFITERGYEYVFLYEEVLKRIGKNY
jgi:predicted transcriptional regulator